MHTRLITGYFLTAFLGILSHFFYEWSGQNPIVALFSPVSESVWEHLKLLFFPVLLYSLTLAFSPGRKYSGLYNSLLLGNLTGAFSIPVLFYTYSGILGTNFLPFDIAVFLAGLFITFYTAWKYQNSKTLYRHRHWIYLFTFLFTASFFIFTFFQPEIGLFQSPQLP